MSAGFPRITVRAEKHGKANACRVLQIAGAAFFLLAFISLSTSCGTLGLGQPKSTSQPVSNIQIEASLPAPVQGSAYDTQVVATGGVPPYQYSSTGVLPPGITLNSTTGVLAGTPTSSGTFAFTIEVTDVHENHGTRQFSLAVSRTKSQVSVTVSPATVTIPSGSTQQFTASVANTSNTAVTWTASPGSISSTGVYTAPNVSANTAVTVTATSVADSSAKSAVAATIAPVVKSNPLVVKTLGVPALTEGVAYNASLTASGGTAPYQWSLASGTLPSGLSVGSAGALTGTTNQTGQFSFMVKVTDSSSPAQTAQGALSLAVNSVSHAKINALFPPMGPGNSTWNAFNTYVLTSSYVDGVNPGLDWNTIETSQGVYDFSAFDASLQHFYDAGKTVNLIVRPASNGGVNSLTPAYVFTSHWASSVGTRPLDVVTCKGYPGNGQPKSGFPVVYELPFKVAYKKFIAAVLAHYANNSHIGYIRVGLAVGGEAFPWCSAQMPGYSQGTWLSYVDEMNAYERSLNPTMQLMGALNEVYANGSWDQSYAAAEARSAVANGQGMGSQGWQEADIANFRAGLPCASDWCALFDQYAAAQIPLELQQAGPSIANGGTTTGSMAELIPFAVAHHASIFEIYVEDLLTAFDPTWAAHAKYGPAYREAVVTAHGTR